MESSIDLITALPGRRTWLTACAMLLLGLSGCAAWWDDVTSRDFKMKNMFTRPDPLVTLRDSTDGHRRGQALARLREPAQHGGDQKQQDFHIEILTEAATKDRDPLCRLGAIHALATYKDPRAVKILEEVYLKRLPFTPDINSAVRMQALTALQKTGNPEARHLLILVAKQPGGGTESSMADRQQTNDERVTAVRGLAKHRDPESIETLLYVMENEKDVALSYRAYESLKTATGKSSLPRDPAACRTALQGNPNPNAVARDPNPLRKLFNLTAN